MISIYLAFTIYSLSFANLNKASTNFMAVPFLPIPPNLEIMDTIPDYQKNYYASLKKWQEEKAKHNNSYEYTILNQPMEAGYHYYFLTTVVKKGVIIKRKYFELRKKEQIEEHDTDKRVRVKWKEHKRKIGTHSIPAQTFDDIYAYCEESILEKPEDYKIVFSAKHNGLLSGFTMIPLSPVCGYGHLNIHSFKWLD